MIKLALGWSGIKTQYWFTNSDAEGGRLAERSLVRVLGWAPRKRFAASLLGEIVLITARSDGGESVTRQGHLRLPLSIRHRLRLVAGDRLLLAGCSLRNLLVAIPTPVLDAMTSAYFASLLDEA